MAIGLILCIGRYEKNRLDPGGPACELALYILLIATQGSNILQEPDALLMSLTPVWVPGPLVWVSFPLHAVRFDTDRH